MTTGTISDAPASGGDAAAEQVPDYAWHVRRAKGPETWISSCKSSLSFLLYLLAEHTGFGDTKSHGTVFVALRLAEYETTDFDGRDSVKESGGDKDDNGETESVVDLPPQNLVFNIIKTIYLRRDSSSSQDSYSDSDSDSGTEGSVSSEIEVFEDGSSSNRTAAEMVIYSEHLRHAVDAVVGTRLDVRFFKKSAKIRAPYDSLFAIVRHSASINVRCLSVTAKTMLLPHSSILVSFLNFWRRNLPAGSQVRQPASNQSLLWLCLIGCGFFSDLVRWCTAEHRTTGSRLSYKMCKE